MEQAERFATELHDAHPGKLLAYNCSPSFNWKGKLSDDEIAGFQPRLGELGYAFQFITLAGFHTLNHSMFELARGYRENGMTRLRRAPAGRVRQRGRGLHGRQAPARGRRELLRGGRARHHRRRFGDHRGRRLDRGVTVRGVKPALLIALLVLVGGGIAAFSVLGDRADQRVADAFDDALPRTPGDPFVALPAGYQLPPDRPDAAFDNRGDGRSIAAAARASAPCSRTPAPTRRR